MNAGDTPPMVSRHGDQEGPKKIICLGGPTGSGKTSLAVEIAKRFGCEIINADSRQVYADFPIITAQPTTDEQGGIEHHLYGFMASTEKISAGQWARMAYRKICEIGLRGKIPLLVGGTGLYFQGLLRGLAAIPEIDAEVSDHYALLMREKGAPKLHEELSVADPVYAAKIHPHDRQRIQRALEVLAATGKPFSWWHAHGPYERMCSGPFVFIDVPLGSLEPFLKERIDRMIAAGALEEASNAMQKCGDERAPAWTGIGCAELLRYLRGETGLDECRKMWLGNTRAYAKRQLTWFRARPEASRLAPGNRNAVFDMLSTALE